MDERALIPRLETESLVRRALKRLREERFDAVLDVGTGTGIIAVTVKKEMPDMRVVAVDISDEALDFARRLAAEEGILVGISCGAAAAVAVRLALKDEFAGKTIVAIMPDLAERYLSTALFEGI